MPKNQCKIVVLIVVVMAAIFVVGQLISAPIFRAGSYHELLDVGTGDFATEIEPVSFDEIPMLDEASASVLGDRKLGELSDMVSQFDVSADYTQINYQGRPVRVAALEYGDFFKVVPQHQGGAAGLYYRRHGDPGGRCGPAFRPGSGGNAILSLRIFQPGPEPVSFGSIIPPICSVPHTWRLTRRDSPGGFAPGRRGPLVCSAVLTSLVRFC